MENLQNMHAKLHYPLSFGSGLCQMVGFVIGSGELLGSFLREFGLVKVYFPLINMSDSSAVLTNKIEPILQTAGQKTFWNRSYISNAVPLRNH